MVNQHCSPRFGEYFFPSIEQANTSLSWNPKQPFFHGCLVKQDFFLIKLWNHPTETTIKEWMFRVQDVIFQVSMPLLLRILI